MRNKYTAGLMGILFGFLGAHRFYLGETGAGCGYLFLGLIFPPIPMLIGFIEGLQLLMLDDQTFNARYNAPPVTVRVEVHGDQFTMSQQGVPMGRPMYQQQQQQQRAPQEPWYRSYRPRGIAEREQVVLAVVRDQGGSVTPADVALHTQLSLQQSGDALKEMELLGVCQTEYDPQTGLARYNFPEFMPRRQQGQSTTSDEELRLGTRRLD